MERHHHNQREYFPALVTDWDRWFGDQPFRGRWGPWWLSPLTGLFDRDSGTGWQPHADVRETEHDVEVRVDVPGIEPRDVEVYATEDALTVRGRTEKARDEDEDGGYHRRERQYGAFERTITLPHPVRADGAKATHRHGVVTITLPKAHEAAGRPIKLAVEEGAGPRTLPPSPTPEDARGGH